MIKERMNRSNANLEKQKQRKLEYKFRQETQIFQQNQQDQNNDDKNKINIKTSILMKFKSLRKMYRGCFAPKKKIKKGQDLENEARR